MTSSGHDHLHIKRFLIFDPSLSQRYGDIFNNISTV